jgi:fructose-1,6-bisphosphatase/inositol monophosphatase family enzyme
VAIATGDILTAGRRFRGIANAGFSSPPRLHIDLQAPKIRLFTLAFGRIEEAVRLTRYGGDCYSYCMLAAGHLDLVVETELKPTISRR